MAVKSKFPYTIIIRDVGDGDYETSIQLTENGEILATVEGIFRSKKEITLGIYLVEIVGNHDVEDGKFILLYGNKVMDYSKNMKYDVSDGKRRISILDDGIPTVIEY